MTSYIFTGQENISFVSNDDHRMSILLNVGERRFEFFFGDSKYHMVCRLCRQAWEKGWGNQLLALCMMNHELVAGRDSTALWANAPVKSNLKELCEEVSLNMEVQMAKPADYQNTPDEQYRWTVIAYTTTGNGLNYSGRRWFKDPQQAMTECAPIFEKQTGVKLVLVEADQIFGKKVEIDYEYTKLRKTRR